MWFCWAWVNNFTMWNIEFCYEMFWYVFGIYIYTVIFISSSIHQTKVTFIQNIKNCLMKGFDVCSVLRSILIYLFHHSTIFHLFNISRWSLLYNTLIYDNTESNLISCPVSGSKTSRIKTKWKSLEPGYSDTKYFKTKTLIWPNNKGPNNLKQHII